MGLLNWYKNLTETQNDSKSRVVVRRPVLTDNREAYTNNTGLTYGLYHNSYAGLKLAGGIAFPAIAIPVYFMGFPVVTVENEDETLKDLTNAVMERFITQIQMINTETHRDGTVWVWSRFDSESGQAIWEFIPDEAVTDIVRSLANDRILAIYTDQEIQISTGRNLTQTVRRQRTWTPTRYVDQFSGPGAEGLESVDGVNRGGTMPIPFTNNRGSGEARGHSDLERILPQLAAYHEIWQNMLETIAKFRTKMVQSNVKDVAVWAGNNGLATDLSDLNISTIDFIMNTGEEKTEFITAEGATEEQREALKMLFHQIVESSGIPEIVWGLKTTGNHASAEENMATLSQYVGDKQRQKTESYRQLFEQTILLELAAILSNQETGVVTVEWNNLDSVSEKVRSEVFKNFADGLAALMAGAAMTKRQAYEFWRATYPGATENTFEEWEATLMETAALNQFNGASWTETVGSNL
ncbi:MAG: hypothetical protein KAJ19_24855 [Gammaproteobacteria bacterium]|nr:hypothetical protein [Gammaproteobacteria bacterium]